MQFEWLCGLNYIAYWHHLFIGVIQDFRKLSQVWVNVCVGNGVSVQSIFSSTTGEGVQPPYIYMIWKWDAAV